MRTESRRSAFAAAALLTALFLLCGPGCDSLANCDYANHPWADGGPELQSFDTRPSPDGTTGFDQQEPETNWVRSVAGKYSTAWYTDVAVDKQGNVVAIGEFNLSVSVDDKTTLSTKGNQEDRDVFIIKYTPGGAVQWAKSFGGTRASSSEGGEVATAVALDQQGNIYVAGAFRDKATFGTITLTAKSPLDLGLGERDVFLAKLSPAGAVLWVRTIQGQRWPNAMDLAVTSGGEPLLLGMCCANRLTADNLTITTPSTCFSFLVKYSAQGKALWAKLASKSYKYKPAPVMALDGQDNILVGGPYVGLIEVGAQTFTATGFTDWNHTVEWDHTDSWFARYSSTGEELWARSVSGNGKQIISGLAADSSGSIYVAGTFVGEIQLDKIVLTETESPTLPVLFLARYTSAGSPSWAVKGHIEYTGLSKINTPHVALRNEGEVYLAGVFLGTWTVGGSTITSMKGEAYVAAFTSQGKGLAARASQDTSSVTSGVDVAVAHSLAVLPSGRVHLCGFHTRSTRFGTKDLPLVGTYDGFLWTIESVK